MRKLDGVVFECGIDEKSLVVANAVEISSTFISALQASLLGGTPLYEKTTAVILGCEESTSCSDAEATVLQAERRGAVAARGACRAASTLEWPLAARRLYAGYIRDTALHLLPFTIEHPTAA